MALCDLTLHSHVRPGALNLHVYHGQNRKGLEFLRQCDIVITTFQTLSSIWRSIKASQKTLFSVTWYRVILDEGEYPSD
jgi:SNF2 family DNA or RNA helicase